MNFNNELGPPINFDIEHFELDIPEIDAQHRRIIGCVRKFSNIIINTDKMSYKNWKNALYLELTNLFIYVSEHFEYEEKLFKDANFVDQDHIIEHEDTKLYILNQTERIRNGNYDMAIEILANLQNIFRNHVLVTDKKYQTCLKRYLESISE